MFCFFFFTGVSGSAEGGIFSMKLLWHVVCVYVEIHVKQMPGCILIVSTKVCGIHMFHSQSVYTIHSCLGLLYDCVLLSMIRSFSVQT